MRAQTSSSLRKITPHPALRATFPPRGEGFSGGGKVSTKNKSICNENAVFLKFRKRWLQMLFCFV